MKVQNILDNKINEIEADAGVLSLGVKVNQEIVSKFKVSFEKIFVIGDEKTIEYGHLY